VAQGELRPAPSVDQPVNRKAKGAAALNELGQIVIGRLALVALPPFLSCPGPLSHAVISGESSADDVSDASVSSSQRCWRNRCSKRPSKTILVGHVFEAQRFPRPMAWSAQPQPR